MNTQQNSNEVTSVFLRVIFWLIVVGAIYGAGEVIQTVLFPPMMTGLAVQQVENSDGAFMELRQQELAKNWVFGIEFVLVLVVTFFVFRKYITRFVNLINNRIAVLLVAVAFFSTGCWKKYDKPQYEEAGASQTAFVIPLEGDMGKQMKFDSESAVKQFQVAEKRIQITHRWNQTGRMKKTGEWIPNVRLILVDRKPETREWTAEKDTGTVNKDQGIWAESLDSVGFSTGFSITAMIEEKDAALFLYRYSGKPLKEIMDEEVRARVQAVFADSAAKYDMSELRSKKIEICQVIREDVIPFFKLRGITITTIGMFGGFTYENSEIQKAIDGVFIAQREKEVTLAMFQAQNDKNNKILAEADAFAEAERRKAKGVADGKAELLKVAEKAAQSPAFLQLEMLKVEIARIEKWNGQYPMYYLGMGADGKGVAPTMMMNLPSATSPTK